MTNRIFYHKSTGQPVQIIAGAQTKPTYQEVICYQELVEPYDHYVMEKKQFFAEYVRKFEDLPLVGRKQIEKREDLPDKQPRISKGEIATLESETEENESEKEQDVSKDPRIQKLIEFFDANTDREKMKLLENMKDELDEFMLNNIAVSLDLSIEDGMDGYERIMSELKIRSKYESERGERF
ncbi:MAG: hypothetical protein J5988_08485 [Eubacterium sp.]|nr:hypothetical protein [Eubacterium sp.]